MTKKKTIIGGRFYLIDGTRNSNQEFLTRLCETISYIALYDNKGSLFRFVLKNEGLVKKYWRWNKSNNLDIK